MADQIVSWGGFNSKGTSGLGVTGSFSVSGSSNFSPNIAITGSATIDGIGSSEGFLEINSSQNDQNSALYFYENPNGLARNFASIIRYVGNGNTLRYLTKSGTETEYLRQSAGNSTFKQSVYVGDLQLLGSSGDSPFDVYATPAGNGMVGTLRRSGTGDVMMGFHQWGGTAYAIGAISGNNGFGFFNGRYSAAAGTEVARFSGNNNLLIGTTTDSARLTVKGSGTTSSTTALLVQNANASSSLQIKDDLTSTFGGSMTIISNDYAGIDLRRTVPNSLSWLQLYATGDFNPVLFKTGTTDWLGYTRISANIFLNRGSQTTLADNSGGQFTGSVVSNNLHIYDGTNSPKLVFWSPLSAQTPRGQISTSDGTSRGGNLIFSVNNNNLGLAALTEYMRITQVGNVGIGTSTPSASLHISGSSNSALLEIDSPAVNNILYVSGSGNVGIGTGTPGSRLSVAGNVDIGGNFIGNIPSSQYINFIGASTGEFRFNNGGGGGWFYTWIQNNSERMRLSTSNNLLIGTTSDSARLTVRGSGTTSSTTALLVQNANASSSLQILDDGQVRAPFNRITNSSTQTIFYGTNSAIWLGLIPTGTNEVPSLYDQNSNKVIIGNKAYATNVNGGIIAIGMNHVNEGRATYNHIVIGNNSSTGANEGYRSDYNIVLGHSSGQKINISGSANTGNNIVIGNFSLSSSLNNSMTNTTVIGSNIQYSGSDSVVFEPSQNVYIGTPLGGLYKLNVSGSGNFTNNLTVTGSLTVSSILTLTPQDPLPSGVPTGSFAVSSSAPPKPYFYDGTTWNALY